jgi:nucleoside-diphosphate-sugar epimerase
MAGGERVLVTGGAGFVGACLVRDLVAAGHEVHLLLRPKTNPWRLAAVASQCAIHHGDLRDGTAVRAAVAACRPEVVYHLAAHGALPGYAEPDAILTTNLLGTAHLLDALDGGACRMIVHAGSSSEYGHKPGPMREADRLEPRTAYAVGKAAATLLCQAAAYQGRPVTTVRIFSAYGPGEDPARLVPAVMACCWRGENPEVTAGWQPRDFIYVGDVVDLLRRAAHCPEASGRILHAGTGRQATVRDMVETILDVCAAGRLTAVYGAFPTRADEPAAWVADISATTALTGWQPRHDLRTGIERTWAWYKNNAQRLAA